MSEDPQVICLVARYREEAIRVPLAATVVTIGSASRNNMVLPFPGVSRLHARASRRDGVVVITDLGSKNGLLLGTMRVDEAVLGAGESVRIGQAVLSLEDEPASDHEAALELEAASARISSTGGTTDPGAARADGSAEALRFVRELEGRGGMPAVTSVRAIRSVLKTAAFLLRAEGLVLASTGSSEGGVILALGGALPAEPVFEAAWAALRAARGHIVVAAEAGRSGVLAVSCCAGLSLIATFDSSPGPSSWQSDLLHFLAFKLGTAEKPPRPDATRFPDASTSSAGEELAVPEGMILGESPAMAGLLRQIRTTVRSRLDVLITGETGTGKELVGRLVHASGPTASGPFVAVNCAAIPEALLESQLFGIQARTATGVDSNPGLFARAEGGSLFLDEVVELAGPLQAKLLRALQEREVLPLGASVPRKIDVRVISTANRDLPRAVREGVFRADLYYRLRGLEFHVPPLRDRREEIPALVLEFASRAAAEYKNRVTGVSRKALSLLMAHSWPGNVRELETEVRRAVLASPHGGLLMSGHFPAVKAGVDAAARDGDLRTGGRTEPEVPSQPAPAGAFRSLADRTAELERETILEALRLSKGNKAAAARLLGVTRNGLVLKIERLRLEG